MYKSLGLVLVVAIGSMTACKHDDSEAAVKPVATKLPKTGLQIDVAPGDRIGEIAASELGDNIFGHDIFSLDVFVSTKPRTLDEAKAHALAQATTTKPRIVTAEALADGWVLHYRSENTDEAAQSTTVEVRRDLGGKSYECSAALVGPKEVAAVIAACKSLRP